MLTPATIQLPQHVFERLRQVAIRQNRSIPDTVDQLVAQATVSTLQDEVERELFALSGFPDDVLLLLVKNIMPQPYQNELAVLNDKAQRLGSLSEQEQKQQADLNDYYQQAILRRSLCLEILQQRGYPIDELLQMPVEPAI